MANEIYADDFAKRGEKLLNGAKLLQATKWHGSCPRYRVVLADNSKDDALAPEYAVWTEYQQADASSSYTAHGMYTADYAEACDAFEKRFKSVANC